MSEPGAAARVREKVSRWAADARGEVEMSQRIEVLDYLDELERIVRAAGQFIGVLTGIVQTDEKSAAQELIDAVKAAGPVDRADGEGQ